MMIKIEKRHRRGCAALRQVEMGHWSSPWWLTGEVVYRDKIGRRSNENTQWLVAQCNAGSAECPARAIIRAREIEGRIGDADPQTVEAARRALTEEE